MVSLADGDWNSLARFVEYAIMGVIGGYGPSSEKAWLEPPVCIANAHKRFIGMTALVSNFFFRSCKMSNVFPSSHPLVKHKLAHLRDKTTDSRKFRELVRELSALLAYEATADLETQARDIETPLATMECTTLRERIGLVPILRAGLGMVEGIWWLLPSAEVWHIGLYRDEKTLKPIEYYNKLPVSPTVSAVFVLDPMLATGGSAVATIDILKDWGVGKIKFVGLIGSPKGIDNLQEHHPEVPIHLAAIDNSLNDVGYILPGLGDAGDRQFGTG
jgi:uracil phosphoribosyltransferase